ncbi:MAG TPA: POTRA domain-containing protein [Candidatus Acidoferrales bacterium]|nr:POTRA domain-containing protein [Candidatus Acidoferrales bacterium]
MTSKNRTALGKFIRAIGAAALSLTFLALARTAIGQDAQIEGKTVAAVHIVDEAGHEIPEKLPALALRAGEPFHIDSERDSLRQLNQTGLFSDIRAEATSTVEGLVVSFVVKRNYYNNIVRVDGLKEPPNEATALAALRLSLGEPFQASALDDGLARLGETLKEDGFYEAKWRYQLTPHDNTREMDIHVEVTPGPRARISSVGLTNQTPFSGKEILEHVHMGRGNEVTSERIDRGTERLRSFLVGAGYLGARVATHRGDYDPGTRTLPISLDVVAGPRVQVEVTGAKFSAKKLRKLLPIYAEGAVDSDLLEEGMRNLRDSLQNDGYFDSKVTYATRQDPQSHEEVIEYQVVRGMKHRLVGIRIGGNKYFSDDLLASRLQIQKESLLSVGKFSQQMVKSDGDSIHALYLANGFLQSQVKSEAVDDYEGKAGHVFVTFQIDEGQQTRVAELHIEGNQALNNNQLLNVVSSTPGQPYSEANITSDRDNILAYYFDEGFPDARFDSDVKPAEPYKVDVTYHITEGSLVDVSKVLLAGYRYTRPGIIKRQVTVKAGGPLREGDVIGTQQKLYNLGIFDRVQVAPQNPEGNYPDKPVVVAVEEGKRYTLSYGFGVEAQRLSSTTNATVTTLQASPMGIFEASKINVGGRAHTASFKVRASTLQYQGLLGYTAPNFLTYPWLSLILTGYADKTRNVNTFTSTRYEGSLQLVQSPSSSTSIFYRYFYRRVLASSLQISVQQIPLFSQPTQVSGFGITWVRDRRNNPADPSRGTFNTVDISTSSVSLGSSASFDRFFMQNSSYTPIGRSFVFARSTQFGVEVPFGGSTLDNVPLPERFFGGGGTSIRGFGLNQAGPRDVTTGFPIGGLAMIVFNQELRFPLKLPLIGNRLGGAVFYDAGNVYSDIHHVSLRYSPLPPPTGCQPGSTLPELQCPNLNYLSHTIGFGFRYATPIGPVRLDLGYQINPASFVFEPTGTTTTQVSQLPHFQFFFNIGSIF